MKKNILLILFLAIIQFADSQEVIYSNNSTDITTVNPAFAGSKNVLRISFNNQLKWINAIHKTYFNSLSADLGIKRVGIGYNFSYNRLTTGFANTSANISFSYRIYRYRKLIITPALKISYNNWRIATEDLVFYDQLSIYDGILDVPTSAQINKRQINIIDLSLGFSGQFPIDIHRTKPIWLNFGFSTDHIPQSKFSFNGEDYQYPQKFNYYAGLLLPIFLKDPKTKLRHLSKIMFYPAVKVTTFDYSTIYNLTFNAYFNNKFLTAIGFQNFKNISLFNKNQMIFSAGFNFNFGKYISANLIYSFNSGVSVNNSPVFMTHEFSLVLFYVNPRSTDCKKNKFNKKRWFNSTKTQQRHKGECPPGMTHRRTVKDLAPVFYPFNLPKSYYWNEK